MYLNLCFVQMNIRHDVQNLQINIQMKKIVLYARYKYAYKHMNKYYKVNTPYSNKRFTE